MVIDKIWVEKYRPTKIDEIVGQNIITRRLKSYVATGNMPHLILSGPPGVGKCCKGDTLILTDKGIIKIEDIVNKQIDFNNRYIDHGQTNFYDSLYDNDNNEILRDEDNNIKNIGGVISISPKLNYERYKIVDIYNMGENDIITIKTRLGLEISGTPEHKIVIIDNNGKLIFKKLQDIISSDHIAISYNTNIFNEKLKLNFFYRKKRTDSQILKNINYMNPDIAELLGYIIAEGNDYDDYVAITNYDREIVNRVLKICRNINIEANENYEDDKLVGVRIGSMAFKEFVYYLGYRKLAQNKEVPWSILQADKDSQISFMRALFDGDGTVEYNEDNVLLVEYYSSSYELCRQLQIMLLNFGIIGRLHSKKGAKLEYRGEIRAYEVSFRLTITGGEILKFSKIINFLLSRKKEILKQCVEILENRDRWSDITYPSIAKIINILYEELKILGQKGKIIKKWEEDFVIGNKTVKLNRQKVISCKEYLKKDKNIYRCISGERQPSIYGLKHILSIMEPVSYLSEYKYLEILSNQFIFDNVVVIRDGKDRVYDVTIDDVHSYIGNSIINHNTASVISLARELFGDLWQSNFMEMNASDERKLDDVRVKVKSFARSATVGYAEFKIIFLDEADALTRDAQAALRRIMENHTNVCRFVLSCNYISKIIEPLQSRCAVYKFKHLLNKHIADRINYIAKQESINLTKDGMEAIVYIAEGDMRKAINALQGAASVDKNIDKEAIYQITSTARPEDILQLINTSLNGDFLKTKIKLEYLYDEGLTGEDIVKGLYNVVLDTTTIPDKLKIKLLDNIGETNFRLSEGANEYIQLWALLSKLMSSR